MRPERPKMEAAGRYYGKDQADRERSDLSACCNLIHGVVHSWACSVVHAVFPSRSRLFLLSKRRMECTMALYMIRRSAPNTSLILSHSSRFSTQSHARTHALAFCLCPAQAAAFHSRCFLVHVTEACEMASRSNAFFWEQYYMTLRTRTKFAERA